MTKNIIKIVYKTLSIILIALSLLGIISINKEAFAENSELKNCPYMCIPPELTDDELLEPGKLSYSDMAMLCSRDVDWNDKAFFFSDYLSAEQTWGKRIPDSLGTVFGDIDLSDPESRFLGLYSKVYKDIKKGPVESALKITASQSGLSENEINKLLQDDVSSLITKGMKLEDAYEERERILNSYLEEKTFMTYSIETQSQITPTELFSNGTIDDSGFDLIVDLNIIEDILFKRAEPPDTGMVINNSNNGPSMVKKVIKLDERRKLEAKCEQLEQAEKNKQVKVKNIKIQSLGSSFGNNTSSSNQELAKSESLLKVQSVNEIKNNEKNQENAQICDENSKKTDEALESYFKDNFGNQEVENLKKEFEIAQENQKTVKNDYKIEDKAGSNPDTDIDELSPKEYEDLKEECSDLKEGGKFPDDKKDINDSINKQTRAMDNAMEKWDEENLGCIKKDTDDKKKDVRDNSDKKDEAPPLGEVKVEVKACINLDFEMETVVPSYSDSDDCIMCHLEWMNKTLEDALTVDFIPDKVTGMLFEPNVCKTAIANPAFNVHFLTKPVITPYPTAINERANLKKFLNVAKNYATAMGSVITGEDDVEKTSLPFIFDNEEEKASNLVFSHKPQSNASVEQLSEQIANIIDQARDAKNEKFTTYMKGEQIRNKSEFGQVIESEMNSMLVNFQIMNSYLLDLLNDCKKMYEITDVK